ncbi:hypothetical protein L8C07_06240 [Paenibacillus sp. CMAA1739]|uniref:hypothetical protein n=1 Tax=Paenibacillus ottowii TaxID=2315729 RepID=UPI002DC02A4E|nr:hypothetical protein [Paenibacillus sp. CMAA1739]MEC4565540.1 hypothetical protein [Paenibacillus sp. CMAA1739]
MNVYKSKIRDEDFLEIWRRLKERSSWWYGELVHCNSWELELMQKTIEKKNRKKEITNDTNEE